MPHGVNDWCETYDLAGSLYCACGFMFKAVRYRWRGEKELRCSATCLIAAALNEEMVSDSQNDASMHVAGGASVD